MTKRIIFFFSFLIFIVGKTQAQSNEGYHIQLQLPSTAKDSVSYLAHFYLSAKTQMVKDTAIFDQNGLADFKGNEKLPHGIYLISMGKASYIQVIIGENQNIKITADGQMSFESIKVLESDENKIFYEYQATLNEAGRYINRLSTDKKPENEALIKKKQAEVETFQNNFYKKYPNSMSTTIFKATNIPTIPDAPKLANGKIDSTFALRWLQSHYFDHLPLKNEMIMKTPFFENKIDYYLDELTYQYSDSLIKSSEKIMKLAEGNKTMTKYLASHIASRYERPKIMGNDAVFVHMAGKYFLAKPELWDTTSIKSIKEYHDALKNVLIGSTIQNAQLTDTTGTTLVPLHSVKAKYLLVFVYDPDCGHCKETAPKIINLQKKLTGVDFKVYGMSINRDKKMVMEFIQKQKTQGFINAYDALGITDFRTKFYTFTTPQMILVDKNKKILARGLEADQIEDLIKKMEAEKK